MGLYYCSINSGSNGNCYYVGNENEAILVDVGISCKEIELRMTQLNLDIQKVKAIFISHEHSDHIKGLKVFTKKYKIPIYINPETLVALKFSLPSHLIYNFLEKESIQIGEISVHPFLKRHDAINPYSFTIQYKALKIGVFTDIGSPCEQLIAHFRACNIAFLEANYDQDMMENGSYPFYLKRRITSDYGHLSNQQALDLFTEHKSTHLSHLLLCHLSKDNNDPSILEQIFNSDTHTVKIDVASRYAASDLFYVQAITDLQ